MRTPTTLLFSSFNLWTSFSLSSVVFLLVRPKLLNYNREALVSETCASEILATACYIEPCNNTPEKDKTRKRRRKKIVSTENRMNGNGQKPYNENLCTSNHWMENSFMNFERKERNIFLIFAQKLRIFMRFSFFIRFFGFATFNSFHFIKFWIYLNWIFPQVSLFHPQNYSMLLLY